MGEEFRKQISIHRAASSQGRANDIALIWQVQRNIDGGSSGFYRAAPLHAA